MTTATDKLVSLLKPKRAWLQFSLATMLVFVAAFCVLLAIRANRQQRRQAAIANIESLGGKMDYLQQWKPYLGGTVTCSTKNGSLKSIYMPKVSMLAWLLGDDGVLGVDFPDEAIVTDADLTSLLPLVELRVVFIGKNRVSDAGLRGLVSLRNLKWIRFAGETNLTNEGIARFQEALPNCLIER
jgi:hypothetical protein